MGKFQSILIFLCLEFAGLSCLKNLQDPFLPSIKGTQIILGKSSAFPEELPYMKNICLYKFSKEFSPREIEKIQFFFKYIRILINTEKFLQEIENNFKKIISTPTSIKIPTYLQGISHQNIFPILERLKSNHLSIRVCKRGIWDIKTYNYENIVWISPNISILGEKSNPLLFLEIFVGILNQVKSSPTEDWIILNLGEILTKIFVSYPPPELSDTSLSIANEKCGRFHKICSSKN